MNDLAVRLELAADDDRLGADRFGQYDAARGLGGLQRLDLDLHLLGGLFLASLVDLRLHIGNAEDGHGGVNNLLDRRVALLQHRQALVQGGHQLLVLGDELGHRRFQGDDAFQSADALLELREFLVESASHVFSSVCLRLVVIQRRLLAAGGN